MIYLILIYVVGYFVSVLALKKFGKAMDFDHYDEPKTYVNYDDYSSNAQAYMSFSIFWPFFWFGVSIFGFFKGLQKLTKKILDS